MDIGRGFVPSIAGIPPPSRMPCTTGLISPGAPAPNRWSERPSGKGGAYRTSAFIGEGFLKIRTRLEALDNMTKLSGK